MSAAQGRPCHLLGTKEGIQLTGCRIFPGFLEGKLSAQKVVNNTGYSGTTRGSAPGVAQEVGNVTVFCALPKAKTPKHCRPPGSVQFQPNFPFFPPWFNAIVKQRIDAMLLSPALGIRGEGGAL
ncbi:hypothetical protein DC28_13945 [Spirochaeta lutea]|uniref:Uncharacterized protein n=1 Tax=Spirochaeta lutea TaxID=1480694 RepID=A0A098QT16_9SPIO|nr:hypothetical protein DC28_13945 [Spirochaeta lutea]